MRLSGRKPSFFTQRWTQRQRVVLLTLIGLNVGAFIAELVLQAYEPKLVGEYLGLSKRGINNGYGWQFLSAIFLHDGPWHLLGNMLVLYLIGRDMESILGQKHFLFLYLAGALGGELGHLLLMPSHCVLLAASGGVAAVLVAFATILPELELTSMLLFVLPIRLKAKHLAYGLFMIAVILVAIDRGGTISHSAYLGGGVTGWLYAHLLGFGRPSFVQRALRQRQARVERYERMSPGQFITEEIDPLLDKIASEGIHRLTWSERRILAKAREKLANKAQPQ